MLVMLGASLLLGLHSISQAQLVYSPLNAITSDVRYQGMVSSLNSSLESQIRADDAPSAALPSSSFTYRYSPQRTQQNLRNFIARTPDSVARTNLEQTLAAQPALMDIISADVRGYGFDPHNVADAYACHCTDCQTRTGAAFSEHMLFAKQDLDIKGDLDSGSYEQPNGALSTIWGCARCKVRIFAENDERPGFASLRCGTLDRSHEIEPAAHLWVNSKQAWVTLPDGVPAHAEQPQTQAEWIALVGPTAS